eukprot:GHVQ01030727.1.p1 GENE.GHVQ01030727.1~~GHVQ01030727.1.p1  ORF type:complete len:159 (+),score=16.98 GHVQ01030727.1:15-491(+)
MIEKDVALNWPALTLWGDRQYLMKKLRNADGVDKLLAAGQATIILPEFYSYAGSNLDESPLFVFDPSFGDTAPTREEVCSASRALYAFALCIYSLYTICLFTEQSFLHSVHYLSVVYTICCVHYLSVRRWMSSDNVLRIDGSTISAAEFVERWHIDPI